MSTHQVTRLTISVAQSYEAFRNRFHAAVPQFNSEHLAEFVERKASWDEVVADANATAPFGFFIFWKLDVDPAMSLNGGTAKCSEYLMGNHTIAERMFRVNAVSMLYVPLRIVLFQQMGGPTVFVIEQPSSILSSLVSPQIDAVASELDQKLVTLFRYLDMEVPAELGSAKG
jgi:hypothetical protein